MLRAGLGAGVQSAAWPVVAGLSAALALICASPRRGLRGIARSRSRGRRPVGGDPTRSPTRSPDLLPAPAELALLADQLAGLARAGLSPAQSWAALAHRSLPAPGAALAAVVVSRLQRGLSVSAALTGCLAGPPGTFRPVGWSRRRSARLADRALLQLIVTLDVSERTGGGSAATLSRFAAALRADRLAEQERESALAGPRATAVLLAALPLGGLALGTLIGARPWHALLATGPGRVCLALGAALWVLGRAWTGALVRKARRGGETSGGTG